MTHSWLSEHCSFNWQRVNLHTPAGAKWPDKEEIRVDGQRGSMVFEHMKMGEDINRDTGRSLSTARSGFSVSLKIGVLLSD